MNSWNTVYAVAMGERERILDHLENDYTEAIRDPVWKHISISRELLKIIELEPFQKLSRIMQLGPAHLVYPGATHTRLSHSLGVFHLAKRMIASLVRRNVRSAEKRGAGIEMSLEGVKAFLCAALLHDVGHYPFAHSLKDLRVEPHEVLSARQIREEFDSPIRSALRIEASAVASIIDRTSSYAGKENVLFYRRILSGVLDPDKLDYLNRDAYFCGVPYGIQDVDFMIEEAYPLAETGVAISPKGITALEDVLFSKYLMYKTVYWHKTVRIATAMIKKGIALALASGAIKREELYGLDDEQFFARFSPERFPPFRLLDEARRRRLYKQVFRIPFHDEWEEHRRLERIEERLLLEERIAGEAAGILGGRVSANHVIVDVPERISFEIEIPILEKTGSPHGFLRTDEPHIFAGRGSEDMPRSLRCISVCAQRNEDVLAALAKIDLSRYLAPA
jgi:HD superfamily phosphohydrolase